MIAPAASSVFRAVLRAATDIAAPRAGRSAGTPWG